MSELTLTGSIDNNVYAGTRMVVEVAISDPRTDEPMADLEPTLAFVRPDGSLLAALPTVVMTESDSEPGTYSGSVVVDESGDWSVVITLGSPYESRWVHHGVYVSA